MKRLVTFVAVVVSAAACAATAFAQSADEVVEKHLAAMGGRAALQKLTNQAAAGTVTIATNGMELSGTVEVWRKAPNKAHSRLTLDLSAIGGATMVVDQICDGVTAVSRNSVQGDRELTGDQLQGMLNASFPSALLDYKTSGATVEFVGTEKAGTATVHVLKFTPKKGPATKLYFDTSTYMLVKSVNKANIAEAGGELEQTSEMSDYRDVGGVKAAFSVRTSSVIQTVTMKLSKFEWNAALDEALFSRGK